MRVKSQFFYLDPRELRAYLFFTLLLDNELYDTNTKSLYHERWMSLCWTSLFSSSHSAQLNSNGGRGLARRRQQKMIFYDQSVASLDLWTPNHPLCHNVSLTLTRIKSGLYWVSNKSKIAPLFKINLKRHAVLDLRVDVMGPLWLE